MPRLEPESTISHYKIKELIASGGMGEVYRAIDLQLGRVIALKTIHTLQADDPKAEHRLLREARAASILSHPSICTIYEIGQEADLTFIAMQYVTGQTIQDALLLDQLPVETVLGYALDIADALHEAHRNGVIHRDIKPSNIIANERGVAVVLDFGLAKQVSFADSLNEEVATLANLTGAATLLGTVSYMSPEQVRAQSLDGRSDIFSLGVTLYEMLSGVRPFDQPHKIDTLHAILHNEPKPLSKLRADVDQRLEAIVGKTLKKDRNQRYQTTVEFKQDLVTYIQETGYMVRGVPGSSASLTPSGIGLAPTISKTARGVFVLPALGFLILLLVIAGVWFIFRNSNKGDSNLVLSLRHVDLISWKSEPGEADIFSSLSPDGKMIAYSSVSDGHASIWIKQTMGGNPVQVTKDEWNSLNPIWSPDNQQIAYVAKRGDQRGIWSMPALGGTSKLVAALRDTGQLEYWSRDGRSIYYEVFPNLFKVDIASGQTTQVTNFDSSVHQNDDPDFSVSPGEDQIAYVDKQGGQSDIWVMPAHGGNPIRLTNDSAEDRNPVWHSDGKRIIYSSLRDGTYQICVAYLDGRKPVQLTSGETDKFVTDVSADGTKILYGSSREESDIWGVKLDTGAEFQVTSDVGSELWPDVSPDNKTIAFQAIRDPGQGRKLNDCSILMKSLQASGQSSQAATGRTPTWSPDGKRLAFESFSSNGLNIRTINSTGGGEKQITSGGIANSGYTSMPYDRKQIRDYSWSPDSAQLIYCTTTPQGTSNLCTISADGSGKPRIISSSTSEHYACPLWSPAGDRIAYLSQATRSASGTLLRHVWLVDNQTGNSQAIFQADSDLRLLGWADQDVIVATSEGRSLMRVNLFRIAPTGNPLPIGRLESAYFYNTQLSPDGRLVAFASHQDGHDNIWLVNTRGGEARKITSNSDPKLYFSSMVFSPDSKTIYYGRQSKFSSISEIDNFK